MRIINLLIFNLLIIFLFPGICLGNTNDQQLLQSWNTKNHAAFLENKGQVTDQEGNVRPDVKFIYAAPGFKFILKENSFSYEFYTAEGVSAANNEDKSHTLHKMPESFTINSTRVDLYFSGANASTVILAEEKSADFNNYYLSHTPESGILNVHSFKKITYQNIYKNIDLVFYAGESNGKPHLKYDIIVHPGGNVKDIKMLYKGIDALDVREDALLLKTPQGELEENIPFSYIKESNKAVKVNYVHTGNSVTFSAKKENAETLVIDPMVVWSTYYGGNAMETGNGIAIDSSGYVFIVGETGSTNNIATSGAYLSSVSSGDYGMLVKLSKSGVRQWGTYYGGAGTRGRELCLDLNNHIIITGLTYSINGIATTGAYQTIYLGPTNHTDAFVAKFNNNGQRIWGTYYGGNTGSEFANGITTDGNNNIIMTGGTSSTSGLSTNGSYQATNGGKSDGFIVKFDSSGSRIWSTFFGGSEGDYAVDVNTDILNNIYIAGSTGSSNNISTNGAHQPSFGGGNSDALLMKFDSSGKRLWSTYYGGTGNDEIAYGVTSEGSNIYITGRTSSTSGIATTNTHLSLFAGGFADGFIVKFDSAGTRKWGTYFGSTVGDYCLAISAADSNLYLIGITGGQTGIATKGVHQDTLGGKGDTFVAKISQNGKLHWSTYFGGPSDDYGYDIAVFNGCSVYITGETSSDQGIATTGAHQTSRNAYHDAFIAKFPTSIISFTGVSSICAGLSSQYKAVKENGTSYTWVVDGGKMITGSSTSDSITVLWNTPGTSSVKLIVAPTSGCFDSVTKTVTVHPLPAALAGPNTSICYGKQASIGAKAVIGNSYSWSAVPAGFTSTLANPTVDPLVTTKYYLKETVIATGCTKTDSVTVTVKPLPLVEIVGDSAYCELGKTSYTTNPETGSTLFWSVTEGTILSGQGTNSILVVWNKWGEGEVKVIETNPNGCVDSSIFKIKIYALPKADFTGTRVCHGDTTIFENHSNNSAVFHWDFGDKNTSSQTHPRHIYNAPGVYNVALSVVSFDGCVDTLRDVIIVDSLPKAAFITDSYICSGEELSFKNNSTSGQTHFWKFGDGTSSALEQPKHTFHDTGTYLVTLIVESINGCIDSVTQEVIVTPLPKADFISTDICLGAEAKFTNQSIFGDTYIWDFGDGNTSNNITASHIYKTLGAFSVQLKAMSKNNCVDSITKIINVLEIPHADFSASDVCLGKEIKFTNQSIFGETYIWSFGDGNSSNDSAAFHTYKTPGAFNVQLKTIRNNGCADSVTKMVTVFPKPDAGFTVTEEPEKRTYTFKANNLSYQKYYWQFDDGNSDSTNITKYTFNSDSTFQISLSVTDINGCNSKTDTTIKVGAVGIFKRDKALQNEVMVYPNPFSEKTIVEFTLHNNSNVSIILYDISGRSKMILQSNLFSAGKQRFILDPGKYNIGPGIYLLKTEINGKAVYNRIVKIE